MGFKLIRNSERNVERLVHAQLATEVERWQNLTHSKKSDHSLLERIEKIKKDQERAESGENSKETPDDEDKRQMSAEDVASSLSKRITDKRANLAQTQGNMDIDRLMELLD